MPVLQLLFLLLNFGTSPSRSYVKTTTRMPRSFSGLKTIKELAADGGYRASNYEVITEDGYSLWLHRLGSNEGPPVMIHHGIAVAADSWVTRPYKDLAFMLLKMGYDVWLSNQRGTAYNDYSLKYNRTDPRFWDFSFHEAGLYDIPAFIDAICQLRGVQKIVYIAHSLGTTTFLAMASSRPEYNSRIRLAVLMSPVAFSPSLEELDPTFRILTSSSPAIADVLRAAGRYEVLERTEMSIQALKDLCTFTVPASSACLDLFGTGLGEHRSNLDPVEWNNFVPYYLAGTSLNTLYHSAQLYTTDVFRQFDYGPYVNIKVYGRLEAPPYQLNRVTAPVALIWSDNDPLLSRTSVQKLNNALPNVVMNIELPDPNYTHLDFLIGKDNNEVLYPKIYYLLDKLKN